MIILATLACAVCGGIIGYILGQAYEQGKIRRIITEYEERLANLMESDTKEE